MKNFGERENPVVTRILLAACAAALAVALTVALLQTASADDAAPPPMPGHLQVDPGHKLFLVGHAAGTQNYICLATGWTFYGPQATVFDGKGEQIGTHFLSPNPDEGGEARATWQDSRDTSAVWARAVESSTDPAYVAPGAVAWLKLVRVGSQAGPTGGDRLAGTTFIQRLNTSGGIAPTTGCSDASHVGRKAFVPYTADYYFYRQSGK